MPTVDCTPLTGLHNAVCYLVRFYYLYVYSNTAILFCAQIPKVEKYSLFDRLIALAADGQIILQRALVKPRLSKTNSGENNILITAFTIYIYIIT